MRGEGSDAGGFLGVLFRMGRAGGVFALAIAAAFVGLAFVMRTVAFGIPGIPFFIIGLVIVLSGGGRRFQPMERAELLALARSQSTPFTVCPRCFLKFNFGWDCPRCGGMLVTVTNEAEREGVVRLLTL